MIPIVTAAHITSYDGYSNYYAPMIYIVTATITSLCSILLQQLLCPYAIYCYSNYYVSMISITTATLTSLCYPLLQHLIRHYVLIATAYYVTMIPISGKRPPCTHSRDWRTPARCAIPGAARMTPRQTSKNMHFVLSYWFFSVLPFVLFDICRAEDHKPRGRASNVSTISTRVSLCSMIYCPLPHPISVRTGWGYHCRVLVRLLIFLLN